MKTRRRGRPRLDRPEKDFGTPELQEKKLQNHTVEILDLYLHKNIISQSQHWCGIHLRWLYTIRYGVPGTRARDICQASGMEIRIDDQQWRASREQEYMDALLALRTIKAEELVKEICIFNVNVLAVGQLPQKVKNVYTTFQKMRSGFEELERLWC